MSVALAQSQGYVYLSCAMLLAKALGQQVLPGGDTLALVERCVHMEPVCWL
jgi:hypothetical protein